MKFFIAGLGLLLCLFVVETAHAQEATTPQEQPAAEGDCGRTLGIIGTVMWSTGIAAEIPLYALLARYPGAATFSVLAVGLVLIFAGIPVWAVGESRRRRCRSASAGEQMAFGGRLWTARLNERLSHYLPQEATLSLQLEVFK